MNDWQRYAAHENPFPPEEDPVCLDANGERVYPGEEIVVIEGNVYHYDDLTVDGILTMIGVHVQMAGKDENDG